MYTYRQDEIIDDRFRVDSLCSDIGGMGSVLHVSDISGIITEPIVLKYCKSEDEESLRRFSREVRILKRFSDNEKIVHILEDNTEYDPPYFVMKFYPDGDLTSLSPTLHNNYEEQEEVAYMMIDCIEQLHREDVYHRDIKPQNFLRDGTSIVVSDLGLGVQDFSSTRFTTTTRYWGTQGYLPPEFCEGEFRATNPLGDIYMLGKSFYNLFTMQNPMFLLEDSLPVPLFHLIEKCCNLNKNNRYQNLTELKQALHLAYDVLLERSGPLGEVHQIIDQINYGLINENKYSSDEIIDFISKLTIIEERTRIELCKEIEPRLFQTFLNESIALHIHDFLHCYADMVNSGDYGWGFAEKIANNMQVIFNSEVVSIADRTKSLELAIIGAVKMNRFAALDTCSNMICSITGDELGISVAALLSEQDEYFRRNIEPTRVKNRYIRNAILRLNEESEE